MKKLEIKDEIISWKDATFFCGKQVENCLHEIYFFQNPHIQIKVCLVPDEWIKKVYLPQRFFRDNWLVGCVKTSKINRKGYSVPCCIYDMQRHEEDPFLFVVKKHIESDLVNTNLLIIQSFSNPKYIGYVSGTDIGDIKITEWTDESSIYGLEDDDICR